MLYSRKTLESIIISLSLITNSCNVIRQINEDKRTAELREQGYDPYHSRACGPLALKQLLEKFNINMEPKEISKQILANNEIGDSLRNILGLIDNDAMMITWPWEILSTLEYYLGEDKYAIISETKTPAKMADYIHDIIKENKKGIALLKDRTSLNHHWTAFPNEHDPLIYYGENTIVCGLYLVEEK